MLLTIDEVEHIANLARLKLTEQEKEHYREQLSQILEFASRLQGVDTDGIPPTSSVLPTRSVLREDIPGPGLSLGELFINAPDIIDDHFCVPPVRE
jgi:aspartyl-tRNA(Asn)/glutamyl-tRNA(Gln) amidotransferase subunit C